MFTNRNSHSDFVLSALERYSVGCERIMIAVPFFTDAGTVEKLVRGGRGGASRREIGVPNK